MADRNNKRYLIEQVLSDPEGGVNNTRGIGGILASLWRQILRDRAISPNRFEILINDFINNAKRGIPEHRLSRHFTRGNLRRELEKPTMTFKVFMKGMKFLKVSRITFAVELHHASGEKSLHQRVIDLGNPQIVEDFVNDASEGGNTDAKNDSGQEHDS